MATNDFGQTLAPAPNGTDDTSALMDAFAEADAEGGNLCLRPTTPQVPYKVTHLNWTFSKCMRVAGAGGFQWWGNPNTFLDGRTFIQIIAQDDEPGITTLASQGLIVSDICFSYVNGFEGVLLYHGGDNAPGGAGSNTVLTTRCHFISDAQKSYMTAKAFIGQQCSVCTVIEDCNFAGAKSLIRGNEVPGGFSNDQVISRCRFQHCTVGQIVNPYMHTIRDCTFEFASPGIPAGITSDQTESLNGAPPFIRVQDNQFWDFTSPAMCIYQPPGVFWHLRMRTNWYWQSGVTYIKLHGPGSVVIDSDHFEVAVPAVNQVLIDLGPAATAKKSLVRVVGNWWAPAGGSQDDAILNSEGHDRVEISNNAATGPWETSSGGAGGGGGGNSGDVVFFDAFTGTNGTSLPSHPPTGEDVVGEGWIAQAATMQLMDGKVVQATGSSPEAVVNCGVADASPSHDGEFSALNGNHYVAVLARSQDANNYWAVYYYGDGEVLLYQRENGAYTLRDTGAWSPDTNSHRFKVCALGTSIKGYVDDSLKVSYDSALFQTVTKHGISLSPGETIDNFKVTSP